APTEGYEDAIVVPEIAAANFDLRQWATSSILHEYWDDLV
ncbi:hypothetical protein Tco_0889248, partial [Tanacetum coccineum]